MELNISEELLENIALCDPITFRGRKKLKELGLADKLSVQEYWGDLKGSGVWIPQDAEKKVYSIDPEQDLVIHYPENFEEHAIITRRNQLEARFSKNASVAFSVIQGVVGSGKTIELHRLLYSNFKKPPFQAFLICSLYERQ